MAQFSIYHQKLKNIRMQNSKNQMICPFESMAPPSERVRSSSEPSTLNDLKMIPDDLSTMSDDLERRKSLSISTIGRYLSKKITKTIAMTATAIPLNSPKQKLIPIVHESSIHEKDMRRNISIKSVAFWEEEFPKY